MNETHIYQKLLADIKLLLAQSTSLDYVSGKNRLVKLTLNESNETVSAERDGGQVVSFTFDELKQVASAFSSGHPIDFNVVFSSSGNVRSAMEAVVARTPNVGYLPANKAPNTGPKKLVWFDKPVNTLGSIVDACSLLLVPPVVGSGAAAVTLQDAANSFRKNAESCALFFLHETCVRFLASNLTKRFCILTGLAGSGKTKLAEAFAMWLCESDQQYRIVAVGADWTSNENLLGYADALQPGQYRAPVNGVLELLLRAQADKDKPYFLILDEMNLSHVERYFADFLSAMETDNAPLSLHGVPTGLALDGGAGISVPGKLPLPANLFIVGTVNVDETTYMFSPKVLDRANVIEFRATADQMGAFLDNPTAVNLKALEAQGVPFAAAFVARALADADMAAMADDAGNPLSAEVKSDLIAVFAALAGVGAEFGFRSAKEIARFMVIHKELSGSGWNYKDALDAQVLQKLMPKLHGSARKLSGVLKALEEFATTRSLTLSLEKIKRMQDRLERDGFTSFAEA